jgi:RimJ/RimL family protein N-acetyltransferase
MFLKSMTTPQLPAAFYYVLDDHTPILVRPVRPDDAPRLKQGFKSLSQLARRRRFMPEDQTELSDEQLKLLISSDQINNVVWGAANIEKPDEPGIGIARYARINGEPQAADVAIVIADDYQGRGAGFVLQACLHLSAWNNGIRTFYYDVLSDNDRIIKHLKLMGGQHAGRASNIDRLMLPVYHRAWDVPGHNEISRRFSEVFKRLQSVEELRAAA